MLKSKLFYAILLLVILSLLAISGHYKKSSLQENIEPEILLVFDDAHSTPTPEVKHDLKFNAWVPYWGTDSAIVSLTENKANNPQYETVSPVWYEVNDDGSLNKKYPSKRSEIIKILKEDDIKLIPAIAMFDHELFTKVLQNEENFQRHVDQIISTVVTNDYDGIDLDYESTKLSDKTRYFDLIKELSEKLNAIDKELVVTVVAKWGDDIIYPSLKETRQVQDWSELAKYASEIRIMAYDYTFIKASLPGPIAPLDWVEQVADYALTQADAYKFSLGIALYAYRWETDVVNPDFNYTVNFMHNTTGEGSANAYQYNQVKNLLTENKGDISNYEAESLFTYEDGGKKYALSYFSPEDIKARTDLAEEYGFNSVSFWRIGNEADQLSLLLSIP